MSNHNLKIIFVITSRFEGGTPNVIAEALHSGCYIVISDVDGASDSVDEGRCGTIFPINDVNALADVFNQMCNDNENLISGGKSAFQYARENFDFEKIVDHLYYLLYCIK